MRFTNTKVFREERFAVGFDTKTGMSFLSIPVSNGLVEYSEFYVIPRELQERAAENKSQLLTLAEQCRRHELDSALIEQPGRLRGEPI